jgi:hypothetical protein
MLRYAVKLAKQHKIVSGIALDGKGGPLRDAASVRAAMILIDKLFQATRDGVTYRGLIDWLRLEVLFGDLHLNEILDATPVKMLRLKRHFLRRGKKDPRFARAWKMWQRTEIGGPDLRACLESCGLKAKTIEREMLKVREFGYSGKLCSNYFEARIALSMTSGASNGQIVGYNRRVNAGRSVKDQVAHFRSNTKPALDALRNGLLAPTRSPRPTKAPTASSPGLIRKQPELTRSSWAELPTPSIPHWTESVARIQFLLNRMEARKRARTEV